MNSLCKRFFSKCKEVTLKRHSAKQKLGLTLCYGSVDDTQTDIFISEFSTSQSHVKINVQIDAIPKRSN
ncbi:hypothetical protein T05_13330 [Trichinella murrelli]|uniref:Uncharacterized protein n=1 Tax=Trichinella murrelli TaxID=144512 RepID=A0A0V0TJJ6_9BILA|nr:hypothetical protein T05_13330 [Trichinella murrelli]